MNPILFCGLIYSQESDWKSLLWDRGVRGAIGASPKWARKFSKSEDLRINMRNMQEAHGVRAIGEIGLDYA